MSIIHVARVAGVSKSTVSRVINEIPGVAPDAIAAVRKAMKKIGYQPPLRRRGPKPSSRQGIRNGNVALLAMGLRAEDLYRMPVFPALLHGLERALAEQNLNLVLGNLGPGEHPPAALAERQADGLLLWGKWDGMPPEVLNQVRSLPAVWLMREHSDARGDFDHVTYNNLTVSRIAARYLLERNHRHTAFLNTVPSHSAYVERQNDFARLMQEAGQPTQSIVVDATQPLDASSRLVEELLRLCPAATGVFVPTDAQLPALYRALQARGVKPGRDIEIISCDNEEPFLSQVHPRPATIDLHLDLVGRRAVEQLRWRMRNPKEPRLTVMVEPTLVEPKEIGD